MVINNQQNFLQANNCMSDIEGILQNPNTTGGIPTADVLNAFNSGNDIQKGLGQINAMQHNQDMPQMGMGQMEWSKLQNNFYDERPKNLPNNAVLRSNINNGGVNVLSQNSRQSQGPPPPYHPTQRSASVPIATQSPNPSSPNNPTSNLSLPSPRTSGTLSIPSNSPNFDAAQTNGPAGNPSSNSNNAASVVGRQDEASSATNSNENRNRNSHNFNSNPSTPISHTSPKELDTFNPNFPSSKCI